MADELRILVTRSSLPDFDEYCEELKSIWESHWLTNRGEKHIQLEQDVAEYLGVDYSILFVNGHNALECAIEAMELHGEIITTPFTFASTTHAIVRKGCTPVFCDIREDNYTMDPAKIEALITDKTVAIMPVHVYGNMCDVDAIQEIADKHGLKVIYDAAHAFGVEKNGIPAGRFGDASMFSFHATKVFHSIEGGCMTTSDPELADIMTKWRNYGITGPEDVVYVGGNAKMNEFAAAMGICNLRHVDDKIASRKIVAERYQSHLDGIDGLDIWHVEEGVKPNYAYFPIMVDPEVYGCTRDDLFAKLAENGIGTRKYFYPLTSDFECYAGQFDSAKDTPIAKRMADRVLTLPMYAGLPLEDVDLICEIVLSCRK